MKLNKKLICFVLILGIILPVSLQSVYAAKELNDIKNGVGNFLNDVITVTKKVIVYPVVNGVLAIGKEIVGVLNPNIADDCDATAKCNIIKLQDDPLKNIDCNAGASPCWPEIIPNSAYAITSNSAVIRANFDLKNIVSVAYFEFTQDPKTFESKSHAKCRPMQWDFVNCRRCSESGEWNADCTDWGNPTYDTDLSNNQWSTCQAKCSSCNTPGKWNPQGSPLVCETCGGNSRYEPTAYCMDWGGDYYSANGWTWPIWLGCQAKCAPYNNNKALMVVGPTYDAPYVDPEGVANPLGQIIAVKFNDAANFLTHGIQAISSFLYGLPQDKKDRIYTGGAGTFSYKMTGLDRNTTYFYRPVVVNAIWTVYGSVESFTTSAFPQPVCTLTSDKAEVVDGSVAKLTWSCTNASGSNCKIKAGSSDIAVNLGTSGSKNVTPAMPQTVYTLYNCSGAGGTADSKSVTVKVNPKPPTCSSYTGNPMTINEFDPSTLSWVCANATSCSVKVGAISIGDGLPQVGSKSVTPVVPSTSYTLTCTGPGGTVTPAPVSITVRPRPRCTFTADPENVPAYGKTTLSWSCSDTSGATPCEIENVAAGLAASGDREVTLGANPTSYTLSCVGPGGTSTNTIPVSILGVTLEEVKP
ncbi:MAG: hypothetical protein PHP03_01715 [Candidatus Pacebacteria bacterium]|nr:hypothetical protein [Candidatus Paceibacterota bacterium]